MADNVPITPGSGRDIATDDVGGIHFQRVKLDVGDNAATIPVVGTALYGIPVDLKRADGVELTTKPKPGETWPISAASAIPVGDNGASLTVDAPVGSPVFVRLSDGTNPITGLPVSGTVTAAQGTPAANSGGWPAKITDGTDIVGITTEGGAKLLKVDIVKSVQGTAAYTDLASIANVSPIAALYNDGATDPTAGQIAAPRITSKRGIHMNLRTAGGAEAGVTGQPIYIAAAASPGTFPVSGGVNASLKDSAGSNIAESNPVWIRPGLGRTRITKRATLSASQSDVVLWTPTSSNKIILSKLVITLSVAGTVLVYMGSDTENTTIFQGSLPIGKHEVDFSMDPWDSQSGAAVMKYTTGTGVTGHMQAHGHEIA